MMAAVRYTLHTEARPNLADLLAVHFASFSIREVVGYWNGQRETGAEVVVVGTEADMPEVELAAERIARENNQEAVLVVAEPVSMRLVTGAPLRKVA